MKSIQHPLVLGLSACALTMMGASVWGLPLGGLAATPMPVLQEPQQQQDQAKPDDAKFMTFTGTVIKQGGQYALRDASGTVYQLDDASRAQPFEGKAVTVTGHLDAQSKTIHVDKIEGASA